MLSFVDVMNSAKGFIRPIREGEALLRSGLIVTVGKKSKEENILHVQGLVLRTSGLKTRPPVEVEVWIDLAKDLGNRVVKDNESEIRDNCDCPAGNSEKCKHIIGVMFCLARFVTFICVACSNLIIINLLL